MHRTTRMRAVILSLQALSPAKIGFSATKQEKRFKALNSQSKSASPLSTSARTSRQSAARLAVATPLTKRPWGNRLIQQGDHVKVTFLDTPNQELTATVLRVLSDRDEGLSPEAEDYVAFWMKLRLDGGSAQAPSLTVMFGTDLQYYTDGRRITLRKL